MIDALKKSLKGGVSPVYVILASSFILVRAAVEEIKAVVLDGAPVDFNLDRFRVGVDKLEGVPKIAGMLPFMAARRLIVIYNCERLKSKKKSGENSTSRLSEDDEDIGESDPSDDLEMLNSLAKDDIPSCVLVFTGAKLDLRTAIAKQAKSHKTIFEFDNLSKEEVFTWSRRFAAARKIKLSSGAVEFLFLNHGANLDRIHSEIEKVAGYIGPGKDTVETSDLQEVMAGIAFDRVFDLFDAVGGKERDKALLYLDLMLNGGMHPIALLASIHGHVKKLLQAASYINDGMNDQAAVRELGGSPYYAGKLVAQAHKYTLPELRNAVGGMSRADFDLKNGRVSDLAVLEKMVLDFCRASAK